MAEALFNKLSKTWKAESAGTNPDRSVHPYTVKLMKEVGVDISKQKPKSLTRELLEKAERIITMGCGVNVIPADYRTKAENWTIEELYGKPMGEARQIRDRIRSEVERLVRQLEPQH
jgi:protein-tyrosine-phosphatase